jgi:hypothetical protein
LVAGDHKLKEVSSFKAEPKSIRKFIKRSLIFPFYFLRKIVSDEETAFLATLVVQQGRDNWTRAPRQGTSHEPVRLADFFFKFQNWARLLDSILECVLDQHPVDETDIVGWMFAIPTASAEIVKATFVILRDLLMVPGARYIDQATLGSLHDLIPAAFPRFVHLFDPPVHLPAIRKTLSHITGAKPLGAKIPQRGFVRRLNAKLKKCGDWANGSELPDVSLDEAFDTYVNEVSLEEVLLY